MRFWVAIAILCAPPLVLGIRGTRNYEWPDEPDFFRDIAQAQNVADGHLLADPFYRGETIWYNPLVPGLVAGLSKITGFPVHTVQTRAGVYLNILTPILFAALAARCFGPVAGVVSLTAFLYWIRKAPIGEPFRAGLLYNANFAQGLFYLTLLVHVSLPEKHRWRHLVMGVLLGITFLAHTAPFLILSVLLMGELVRDAARDPKAALKQYALLFGTAALVATPLLVSIIGHYHLKVQNRWPMDWIPWSVGAHGLARQLDLYTLATCVALVALWIRGPRPGARVASGWVGSVLVLILYSFAAVKWGWPTIVPRHHLVGYLWTAQAVLIGYGASVLWSWAQPWVDRGSEPTKWVATTGVVSAVLLLILPGYVQRAGPQRTGLTAESLVQSGLDGYQWMRSALSADDVVLATDDRSLMAVGPSGAKAVAVPPVYSNPYVDYDKRVRDRDEMFAALGRGDESTFEALADEYSVTYVLWVGVDGPWLDHTRLPGLVLAFDNKQTRIYRRTTPARPRA